MDVLLDVLFIPVAADTVFLAFYFALNDESFLNWLKGVSECDDSNQEHEKESSHVYDTLSDHANEPTEHSNCAKIEQEAEPNG